MKRNIFGLISTAYFGNESLNSADLRLSDSTYGIIVNFDDGQGNETSHMDPDSSKTFEPSQFSNFPGILSSLASRTTNGALAPIGQLSAEAIAHLHVKLLQPSAVCSAYQQEVSSGDMNDYLGVRLGNPLRPGGTGVRPGGTGVRPSSLVHPCVLISGKM